MPYLEYLEVIDVAYLDGYRLSISFNDGKDKIVDFSNFLKKNNKEALNKYKLISNFKNFKIDNGNIVWGRNWDLIFPIDQLYNGEIN